MNSYTFKIKQWNHDINEYMTILALHMPFESFYESVRITPVLKEHFDKFDKDDFIVTCSDYIYYNDINVKQYLINDRFFANLELFYASKNIKDFLANEGCSGWLNQYPDDELKEEVSEDESI